MIQIMSHMVIFLIFGTHKITNHCGVRLMDYKRRYCLVLLFTEDDYRQVSNIRRTKSQLLKDSRTVLRLSLPNPLKLDIKSRMKM